MTGPAAFYCDGAGFPAGAAGVVAGRLGANQAAPPYTNPFGNGTLCQNRPGAVTSLLQQGHRRQLPGGLHSNPARAAPTATSRCSTLRDRPPWNHGITVWRNNSYNPIFDTSYQYTLSANLTGGNPMVMDAAPRPFSSGARRPV